MRNPIFLYNHYVAQEYWKYSQPYYVLEVLAYLLKNISEKKHPAKITKIKKIVYEIRVKLRALHKENKLLQEVQRELFLPKIHQHETLLIDLESGNISILI